MCMLSHIDDLLRTFLLRCKGTIIIITAGNLCFELFKRLLMEVMKNEIRTQRKYPKMDLGLDSHSGNCSDISFAYL